MKRGSQAGCGAGDWRLVGVGGWWLVVGGPWGRSSKILFAGFLRNPLPWQIRSVNGVAHLLGVGGAGPLPFGAGGGGGVFHKEWQGTV